jgi:hypothetical protein
MRGTTSGNLSREGRGVEPASGVDELYQQLLTASRSAFDQGDYETAYHALTAALHRAAHLGSRQAVAEAGGVAEEQVLYLSAHPEASLSRESVLRSDTLRSVYSGLVRQAETMADMLYHRERIAQRQRETDKPPGAQGAG